MAKIRWMVPPMISKKPGMLDPWRAPPRATPSNTEPSLPEVPDFGPEKKTSIQVKNYGGISIDQAVNPRILSDALLQFLVDHEKVVDPILTEFGIVLLKVEEILPTAKLYIHRVDGWTLAIPEAASREEGLFRLLQAFRKIAAHSELRKALSINGISVYKN